MKTNASLRNFLLSVYGYAFFNKFLLISPVYSIFMQNHGISELQFSLLFVMLSLSTIISQIPVVWIVSKLGRKNTIMLGQLLKGIGFITWLVWPTFPGFILGMCLWGMMSAVYSSVFEAMIYDELSARRHNNLYARVLGMRYTVQAVGAGMAAFGSLLMFAGYECITIASLVSLLLSVLCISRVKTLAKGENHTRVRRTNNVKIFKTAFRVFHATPCVFLMMLLCLFVTNFSYVDDFLSPIGIEIGLPVAYVGSMQFLVLGCMIIGQTFAYRFEKIKDWILYGAICVLGTCFLLFSLHYAVAGLLWFGLAYILSSGLYILLYSRFQDFIPPSYRTVILSFYNIASHIVYIVMCLVMGFGGTLGSWRYSIVGVGCLLISVGIWALTFIRNKCARNFKPYKNAIKTMHEVGSDIV